MYYRRKTFNQFNWVEALTLKLWLFAATLFAAGAVAGAASAHSPITLDKNKPNIGATISTPHPTAARSQPRRADELLQRLSDALTRRIDNDPDAILAASREAGAMRMKSLRTKIGSVPPGLNNIGARKAGPEVQSETTFNHLDGK